ncbi:hypothetical protein LP420_12825 [Massilia sp. B-10]|nr:hypothetical protein LP420_12825 [Massilia sp. B-10]
MGAMDGAEDVHSGGQPAELGRRIFLPQGEGGVNCARRKQDLVPAVVMYDFILHQTVGKIMMRGNKILRM